MSKKENGKEGYAWGYDPFSRTYIVGLKTKTGLVEKPLKDFSTPEEARAEAIRLNKKGE